MNQSFNVECILPTTAQRLYECWLDSESHSEMTGAPANCSNQVGGIFSAWDGYATGKNLELEPGKRIIQSWRTTDFQENDPDSMVEIEFQDVEDGCLLSLHHRDIPEQQPDYQEGWVEYYFEPMKQYFK